MAKIRWESVLQAEAEGRHKAALAAVEGVVLELRTELRMAEESKLARESEHRARILSLEKRAAKLQDELSAVEADNQVGL